MSIKYQSLVFMGSKLNKVKQTWILATDHLPDILRQSITRKNVMQSDGNSFGGDVVSDSFNKTCRDEDNIS